MSSDEPKGLGIVNSKHSDISFGNFNPNAPADGVDGSNPCAVGESSVVDPGDIFYSYRDFATVPVEKSNDDDTPNSLAAQKCPAKLATMLQDADLRHCLTWLPHGRSWKVTNRELFSEHGLPRYFGHKNFASFVRIINAWGFRRITKGADRDSYYHEFFLRGRPDLHDKMRRLSASHRKTPISKEEKTPDFYQLAKTSPLPDVPHTNTSGGPIVPNPRNSSTKIEPIMAGTAGVPPAATANYSALYSGNLQHSSGIKPFFPGNTMNSQMLSMLANESNHINSSLNAYAWTPRGSSTQAAIRLGQPADLASLSSRAMDGFDSRRLGQRVHSAAFLGRDSVLSQPPTVSVPGVSKLQRDNEELRQRIQQLEQGQSQGELGKKLQRDNEALRRRVEQLEGRQSQGEGGQGQGREPGGNQTKDPVMFQELQIQSLQRDIDSMRGSNNPNLQMNMGQHGMRSQYGEGGGGDATSYIRLGSGGSQGEMNPEEVLLRAMQMQSNQGLGSTNQQQQLQQGQGGPYGDNARL